MLLPHKALKTVSAKSFDPDWQSYWEDEFIVMTEAQRIVFGVIVTVITIIGVFGNVLTIAVCFCKDQRILFKFCLMSLSLSDLIFLVVSSALYMARFWNEKSVLWYFGDMNCYLLPFLQTMAALVSSISLSLIALDRYIAIVRILKGKWQPGFIFCIISTISVWIFSAVISSPMLVIYYINHFYVAIRDPTEPLVVVDFYKSSACFCEKEGTSKYFGTVFAFIFLPMLVSFICLNSLIANEIWKRRRLLSQKEMQLPKKSTEESSKCTQETTNTSRQNSSRNDNSSADECFSTRALNNLNRESIAPKIYTINKQCPNMKVCLKPNARKQRQLRMFKVIVVLMAVYLVCRIPSWVFLLYKLNNNASSNLAWVLQSIFGILALLNTALNPFLYMFLQKTIQTTTMIGEFIREFFSKCGKKKDGGVYLGD